MHWVNSWVFLLLQWSTKKLSGFVRHTERQVERENAQEARLRENWKSYSTSDLPHPTQPSVPSTAEYAPLRPWRWLPPCLTTSHWTYTRAVCRALALTFCPCSPVSAVTPILPAPSLQLNNTRSQRTLAYPPSSGYHPPFSCSLQIALRSYLHFPFSPFWVSHCTLASASSKPALSTPLMPC